MKNLKVAIVLAILVAAATTTAHAQNQVFVPGNASGFFGNPADEINPLVAGITVTGPGTITVTYVSGVVYDAGCGSNGCGPTGAKWKMNGAQSPLQEAKGVSGGAIHNLDALIGVFVPASRVNRSGFNPVDGTKDVTKVGIMPNGLFFIGTGISLPVTEAGTLYLGINDWGVGDNSGGFNVDVSVQ